VGCAHLVTPGSSRSRRCCSLPRARTAAGPDLFGYRSLRSADVGGPSFAPFVDVSTTGTRLFFVDPDDGVTPNADDGVALDVPLGALNGGRGFPFYGTFHTTVAMSTNGFLDFAPSAASDVANNQCPLPDPTVPNSIIAVLWTTWCWRTRPIRRAAATSRRSRRAPIRRAVPAPA
jgi:hypothetical protein